MQLQVLTIAVLAAMASAQTGALLPRCDVDVSAAFNSSMNNQSVVCMKDQNIKAGLLLDVSLFCATPSCIKMMNATQAQAATCRPNATILLPTKYCEEVCRQKLTAMQLFSKNCKEVETSNLTTYCTFCNKFTQEADSFIDACGLWDSASALRDTITTPRAICDRVNTAVPPPAPESSSTTYIIIGAIGGVVLLGAAAYVCLKKKKSKYEADYRSAGGGSHMVSGGSNGRRSPGGDSTGTARTNQLAQVTMQNDIRFDTELAQFRIPQQEIQNISLLVKGGYGVVFHATFNKVDVAMKQLLPSKAKDQNAIQDFMNEIRLCARLEHPKIVTFVGISWSTLQDLAVLSEFMANGDVTGLIRKERKKPDGNRLLHWVPSREFGTSKTKIAADVIDALVYLHSFQPTVIHRDLKSKNVLLSATWEAKLSDFGISRVTSLEETMTSNIGTVAWIAPEVLTGGRYTEKADIYSFGVLLSELDTLQVPYAEMLGKSKENGFSNARLAMMVSEGALQPTFTDGIPSQLHQLAMDCLNFHDNDRPSAMKLSYQLHSILKDFDTLHK
ncbi:hypothetical protein DYB26_010233 [Aphanomyces astaci]|uniref:Protein kinase domain-containing protein n=1 Tax=Aphanomyces astaci TaxID=112090 RepID=A0A3R7B6X6_APHAT|nr:hypothetical protein DYB26_010233 [Aphanomyces astaci]